MPDRFRNDKVKAIDIAEIAGVSQPTVSRALRNSPLVSQATRERIQQIARDLNYKVDVRASKLRSNQTNTIALLIYRDSEEPSHMINPFFLTMLSGITHATDKHGYDLLVSFQQLSENWVADYEFSHKADGIIFLGYGAYTNYINRISSLSDSDSHFVTWGPVVEGQPGYFIGCDNRQGGYKVGKHLIELNHSKLAFLGDVSDDCPEYKERFAGFIQALQECSLNIEPDLIIDADSNEESGYRAAQELLKRRDEFTAVFCASDLIAVGAYKAIRENGLNIPDDISIVGFDDLPRSRYISPELTSVSQNTHLAGEILVDAVLSLIEGENSKQECLLEPSLIIRNSTKAI